MKNLATAILAASMTDVTPFVREPKSGLQCSGYFDDLADLDMGSLTLGDMMGATRRGRRGGGGGRGRRGGGGNGFNSRRLIPRVPGVPMPGARLQPLGFGSTSFTATSGSILQLQGQPQRPFKGQRLVVDTTRTGTTSTGLVTITRLDIGTANQLVSSGALSAAAFAATAFDVNLQLDPATPGILITLQFANSTVPTSPDHIDVGATLFGTAVG